MTVTHDSVAPIGTQPLRKLEDLVQDLATLTGLSSTQLDGEINHLEFPSFQFQGLTLVSPSMTDTLIDRWAESLKTKLRESSTQNSTSLTPSLTPSLTATETTDNAETSNPEPSRLSQKRSSAPPKAATEVEPVAVSPKKVKSIDLNAPLPSIELKVPKDVFNLVSTRYDVAMRKVLPDDESSRKAYLQHIVNESDQGQEFLMQIALVLAKKYKGRVGKETAYKRMLEKAHALAVA